MNNYDMNLCRCGEQAQIVVMNPQHFGIVGAVIKCPKCRASSSIMGISRMDVINGALVTTVDDKTLTDGIKRAIADWNCRNTGEVIPMQIEGVSNNG